MEEENNNNPFWLQQDGGANRRLRRSNSLFINSGALLIILVVTALAFIFIIAPTLQSFTSHIFIFKPHAVKRTWDSLNLVLVLFAILCGFLSRNNNNTNEDTPRSYSYQDQSFSISNTTQDYTKPNPEIERQGSWYEYNYSYRTPYSYKSYNRLRSVSSYPDLRQESSWAAADEGWRFYDDTHVNGDHRRPRPVAEEIQIEKEKEEEELLDIKNVEVDTFEVIKKEVPSVPPLPEVAPPSPPPPPRRKDARRKVKGMDQDVGQEKNHDLLGANKRSQQRRKSTPPSPPPAPLPSPSPPPPEERTVKEKNRSKSATKEFLTSLKGKKKKQRHKSVENFETILMNYSKPHHTPPSQPPPPPPPPPPPSVFQSLFSSKKSKHKKSHVSSSKTEPVKGVTTLKPRLRESFYTLDKNVSIGNESPLNSIPPPPPPPPFNMPAWKFKVKGDYVRIDSISSTSSDLPDLEEIVESPKEETSEVKQCNNNISTEDGGEPEILLFYPSPSVDIKAGTFIQKFRDGLRMEKMNSIKSNLGHSIINTENKEEAGSSSRYKGV